MIVEFLMQNWLSVLIFIFILSYIAYLSVTRQWGRVREFAYQVMLLAERTFSDNDGQIKFDFVVRIVYKNMPAWLRLFLKEENMKKRIQGWYEIAKDFLDDGMVNHSVK